MIQIDRITKSYNNNKVLDINHLEISQGETVGLVGNNGAGKTTLFRIILDLILPDTGEVLLNNLPVKGQDGWKSFTGAFIDERFLIDFLTVREYFEFIGDLHNLSDKQVDDFFQKMEPLFDGEIKPDEKKLIREFSSGNKKKIGIAAAMMGDPKLVILDEPFTALDPTSQIRLKKIINEQNQEQGTTFFISSHDLNHITEVSKRILVLQQGELIKDIASNEDTLKELEDYFNK